MSYNFSNSFSSSPDSFNFFTSVPPPMNLPSTKTRGTYRLKVNLPNQYSLNNFWTLLDWSITVDAPVILRRAACKSWQSGRWSNSTTIYLWFSLLNCYKRNSSHRNDTAFTFEFEYVWKIEVYLPLWPFCSMGNEIWRRWPLYFWRPSLL